MPSCCRSSWWRHSRGVSLCQRVDPAFHDRGAEHLGAAGDVQHLAQDDVDRRQRTRRCFIGGDRSKRVCCSVTSRRIGTCAITWRAARVPHRHGSQAFDRCVAARLRRINEHAGSHLFGRRRLHEQCQPCDREYQRCRLRRPRSISRRQSHNLRWCACGAGDLERCAERRRVPRAFQRHFTARARPIVCRTW